MGRRDGAPRRRAQGLTGLTGAMRIDVAITGADGVEDGVGGPEGVQHLRDVAAVASSLADGLADELRRKWAGAHT